MEQIQFYVSNQMIRRTDRFKVVSDSRNYLYAKFTFGTDEWKNKTITAIFKSPDTAYEVILDENNTCLVPWEVLQKPYQGFYVSCFAGDLITVNTAQVVVIESGYEDDLESSQPPTPSVYNQIIERMDGVEDIVIEKTALAEEYAEQAEGSAVSAAGSASTATQKAAEAAQSAETASGAAGTAETAKSTAVEAADASQTASQTAVNAAGNASASELSAAQSAQSASENARTASNASQVASTKADEASQSASRAAASASEASTSATHAAGAATSASGYASDANASATAAAGSAQTASTKASQASASASSAEASANTASTANANAQAAKTAAETAQGAAEDAQEAAETARDAIQDSAAQIAQNTSDIDFLKDGLNKKVDITGIAPNAEQLIGDKYTEESVPYLFRKAGGSADIGNREADMLVGGTVVWNQLSNPRTSTVAGITWTVNEDGSITVNGTATGASTLSLIPTASNPPAGHKILFYFVKPDGATGGAQTSRQLVGTSYIHIALESDYYRLRVTSGSVHENVTVKAMLFDLTQMFGTTIADYIYSLEQATTGAGVEFFRKLFPNDYYEYNAGELISVSGVSAHEMTGFNQWDEEWERANINWTTYIFTPSSSGRFASKNYIPVISGATYYFNLDRNNTIVAGYTDDTGNGGRAVTISQSTKTATIPPDVKFIKFGIVNYGTTYNNNICINFSDPVRNGEYEPYKKHSYPLDDSLTLRGIPKLDANNQLYYDGDTYEHDGTVTRRYGVVDLGTLTWTYRSTGYNTKPFYALLENAKMPPNSLIIIKAIVSTDYAQVAPNVMNQANIDKVFGIGFYFSGNNNLNVIDNSYSDAASFKAAMSGVMLVYELATPTTETAEAFAEYQTVDKYGTEEYVSTSIVPVGHVTKYYEDLRKKLEDLPSDIQINGTSIVSDGVANVPVMDSNNFGVAKIQASLGIGITGGKLALALPTATQIKKGNAEYGAITTLKQHESVFYGLAKLAGANMASSSNPVGEYTDEAKIAIQKMLGIYEAPWELIREDTFTNETEADHEITVDANGEAFELTDIAFMLWLDPTTTDASTGSSGAVRFYFGSEYLTAYFGAKTVTVGNNPQGASALIMQKDGLLFRQYTRLATFGTDNNAIYTGNQVQAGNGWLQLRKITFNKIVIKSITGSAGYRLFAKRKWQ